MSFSERGFMEELDFCISREYIGFSPAAVDSIYHVFADGDYHIRHLAIPDSLVFVATLGGEGRLLLAEKSFLLHSGEIMIFDASQRPFEYLCTGTNWNFWWFEFRATEPDFPSLPREIVLSLPLEEFHLRMCSEALSSLKLKNSVAASSLLISLLRLLGQKDHGLSNVRGGVGLFQEADRYIRRNLASVTVQSTAMHLGISEHTLLNIFQSLLGIRTVEYIHNMKTDMARHLLISSEKPLREIAWELGYADQFVFSKSFRKRFGISPSDYRAAARSDSGSPGHIFRAPDIRG